MQVMAQLLGFEGCEFYTAEHPELVGLTFGEISLRFASAIPLGVSHIEYPGADPEVQLNPPRDMVRGICSWLVHDSRALTTLWYGCT
jgi:hypothetical protein